MAELNLKFHLDDVTSIDDLALLVGDWEVKARERSERSSISPDMKIYYRGVAEAMQAVRLQFTRLQVGIRPVTKQS